MASTKQSKTLTTPTRSRTGCYTCKIRKVKCGLCPSDNPGKRDDSSDCLNCQRLGFECRWNPPAPGEQYVPPPKRRRKTDPRNEVSGQPDGTIAESSRWSSVVEDVDQSSAVSEGTSTVGSYAMESSTDHGQEALAQFSDLQLDVFGNLATSFDFDFDFRSNPFDFNLAGEGLDFIPLPAVDSSAVHSSMELAPTPALNPQILGSDTGAVSRKSECDPHTAVIDDGVNFVPPTLDGTSQHLIQHYLEVMKGYSKVDDRPRNENNLFISAFSESLCFPPLLYAILAFSASHLSIQDPSYKAHAENFSSLAATSFNSFVKESNPEERQVERLLSALFVRVKKVHVMAESMDSFLNMMALATDIISTEAGEKALQNSSNLARRILLRLAILDARAGCYRLGGGQLVSKLRQVRSLSFLFDFSAPLEVSYGDVINLLRADILRMRVGELDTKLQKQQQRGSISPAVVGMHEVAILHSDIRREIDRWESYSASRIRHTTSTTIIEAEVLDSQTYGCYAVLSALHSAMLYLHSVFPLLKIDDQLSITRILHYQLKIHMDTSRADTPSSILPSSLILAGIYTNDPIHRDWVIKLFKGAERWGVYIHKQRKLQEALIEMKSKGRVPQIIEVMDQVTGRFLI